MKKFAAFLMMMICASLFATSAFAYEKGDRVLVLWEDAFWYPGTVQSVDGNVVLVYFDDGDKATADSERVNKLDWDAGDLVECRWPYNNKMYKGRFVKRDGEKVRVVFDDGDKADLTMSVCRQSRESRLVGR